MTRAHLIALHSKGKCQGAMYWTKSGVSCLAVTTPERNNALPEVPSSQELGYEGYDAKAWFALAAPKGTPENALERLHEATAKVIADSDFAPYLEQFGLIPFSAMNLEEIDEYIKLENERWCEVISENEISLD